jgi:hypothetical protein
MKNTDDRLAALLSLAEVEPDLRYQWRGALPREALAAPTDRTITEYFESHPPAYVEELRAFNQLNSSGESASKRIFVFVVCYNELANLERIVKQYASQEQIDLAHLQLTFLVNYKLRSDAEKTGIDARIFERSVARLIELKKEHDFVHIVAKRFSAETGGLARARKYAMDYSLLSCSLSRHDPAGAVLISNEGDTLELPRNYLRAWVDRFAKNPERLVQGNIAYPGELERAPLVQLYAHVRERVHLGQGLHDRRYPFYEGVMPTGRNYAVHPKVACLAGGIDAIALPGAEDDLTFGSDVHNLVGPESKVFADEIALTTHPRREIVIVHDLLGGRSGPREGWRHLPEAVRPLGATPRTVRAAPARSGPLLARGVHRSRRLRWPCSAVFLGRARDDVLDAFSGARSIAWPGAATARACCCRRCAPRARSRGAWTVV